MAEPQRFDTALRVAIAALLAAVLALGGWFAYTVYADRKAAEDSNPALRIMKVIKAQVATNPNDAVLRVRLGEAYAAAGKSQQAIEQFNAALKIDPKHTGAYLDLGSVAMSDGRADEARTYLKKVIEITDADAMANTNERREQAFYRLGQLEATLKNYDAAIGSYKNALRIRDDASDTYYNLAMAFIAIGQNEEAKANLTIALRFDPNFAQGHYQLGKVYLAEGDKVRASAEIGRAVQLAPTAPEPTELAAKIGDPAALAKQAVALEKSDPEAALEAAAIAFNLDPVKNVESGKLEARLLLASGDKTSALTVYKTVAEVAPNDAEVKAAIKKLTKSKAKSKATSGSGN
jgi:tetratricopeptide (TPR) repeat protein